MMKTYCTPEMILLDLSAEDILTASSFDEGDPMSLPSISFDSFTF